VYATTVAESLRATGAMRESLRTTLDWDARPESVQTFAVRRARFAEREASGLRLALRLTLPSTAKFSSGFLKDALDVLGEVPETWPALASEKERSRSMASAVSFATRGRVSDFRRTQSPLAPAGDVPWGAAVTVLEGTLDVPSSSVASFDRAQPASKVARRRTWLTASGTIEAGENEVARWGELPWGQGAFGLFLYEPRSGKIASAELAGWDEAWLRGLRAKLKPRGLTVEFPRVQADSGLTDETATLKALGWMSPLSLWHRVIVAPTPSTNGVQPTPVDRPVWRIDKAFLWIVVERETGLVLALGESR